MKPYATFRRHPLDQVVPRRNEDLHPREIVPFGLFGGGLWTGHPIGLFIVIGMLVMAWMGIPAWRWFFGATLVVGSAVAYSLWRRHRSN